MDAADLALAVPLTARLSALLFASALIVPVLLQERLRQRIGVRLFLAFIVAHTIHFAFVTARVLVTGGRGMFPGGRDVADAGGLPAVFGIFAFFYLVAGVAWSARRAGVNAHIAHRYLAKAATVFLGYMFISTYLPLLDRSAWYAVPAALIASGIFLDLFAQKFRALSCVSRAR